MEKQAVAFAKKTFQRAVLKLMDLDLCGKTKSKEAENTRKLARCMARMVAEKGGRVRPFNCEDFRESLQANVEILHESPNPDMRSKARRDLKGKLHALEELMHKHGKFECLDSLKEEILKALGGQGGRAKRTKKFQQAA